jgi:phosphoglycolate phosphatase
VALGLLSLDLDGTLVDTAGEIAEAANRALVEHGWSAQPVAEVRRLIGLGGPALIEDLLQRLPPRPVAPAALLAGFERHLAEISGTLGAPYPGAHAALALLRAHGMRLACVTNKAQRATLHLLQRHRLHAAFDLVLGGDALPQRKPDARVLQHVSAAMGVPLQAMAHVGDSATDMQAARNAGVRAWAVPYGYNRGRPIAEAAPDRIFDDLMQVARAALAEPGV